MAATTQPGPARAGFHTITPYLVTQDLDRLIAFVQQVFAATETLRMQGAAGGTHVEVRIGDSMLMIGGGTGEAMPAALYVYVEDVDAVYQRALAAGATTLMEPSDEADGDRRGGVQDFCGNQWFIARHVGSAR
jgi:PhnB protein